MGPTPSSFATEISEWPTMKKGSPFDLKTRSEPTINIHNVPNGTGNLGHLQAIAFVRIEGVEIEVGKLG